MHIHFNLESRSFEQLGVFHLFIIVQYDRSIYVLGHDLTIIRVNDIQVFTDFTLEALLYQLHCIFGVNRFRKAKHALPTRAEGLDQKVAIIVVDGYEL